jgi:ATP-dependent exoDNAse (exonuclease V) alpha subunit
MAIFHLSVKTLGRTKNHKAVAAAAYRSGTKLNDEHYAMTHDYTQRKGVAHCEIMAPNGAPEWAYDRERLWNEVEKAEKRKDSQVAREIEVALPRELQHEAQLALVRRFVVDETVALGMVADIALHERHASDGGDNPHAHILLTMRTVGPEGFGPKDREWNKTELVESWRERWGTFCNEALAAAGEEARVDHRTLAAQGIMREPTLHLGKEAFHAEQRGLETARAERQPSRVERLGAAFQQQIGDEGHITLTMTPEAGQNWLEKMASFTQRVSERVERWYEQARDTWQSWVRGKDDGEPAPERGR